MEAVVLDGSYYVPITLINPFNKKTFPKDEESILVLIDTGFDGFIIINKQVYEKLELNQLKSQEITIKGICCKVKALKIPIRVSIPELNLKIDGEAILYDKNRELIVGTEFLSYLQTTINGCMELITINNC